jgi:acyl-CoA synthetase (AMP-forming)/AMP-acid ligase II
MNDSAGFILGFDPVEEATAHGFVPLEDIVVVVLTAGGLALPDPSVTALWPARFEAFATLSAAAAALGVGDGPKPYVLCGLASAVASGLQELHDALHSWPPPLYVVTDATQRPPSPTGGFYASDPYGHPHGAPRLVRHLAAPSLARTQWEEAVAVVCAAHVASVAQMILSRARQHPHTVAIRGDRGWGAGPSGASGRRLDAAAAAGFECEALTYAELCNRAWVLGDALASQFGVAAGGGDNRVGVTLPPSPLSPVCFLALGLRGLCAVNVAPTPPDLRAYQLTQVKCQLVLALAPTEALDGALSEAGECANAPRTVYVDRLWRALFGDGKGRLLTTAAGTTAAASSDQAAEEAALARVECVGGAVALRAAALVEWTSGSTGKPKAMAVTQWRLSHWVRWRVYHLPLAEYGRVVGVGLFWLWYWHLPLCQGGELAVIPSHLTVDVVGMVAHLQKLAVDWVDCLSPGQLNMLVEVVDQTAFPKLPFTHVMSSGEALPVAVAAAFLKRFPGTSIGNCLSTTETAADACCLKDVPLALCQAMLADADAKRTARRAASSEDRDPSAGPDDDDAPAVAYVPVLRVRADGTSDSAVWGNALGRAGSGERLLVKGWNVEPNGYLTGEAPDAFKRRRLAAEPEGEEAAEKGEGAVGCFYSGDRAVWRRFAGLGDLYLCIEGRVDDVVKVRGHRVDLAGVEAVLGACALVADCAALCHEDSVWACVVLKAKAAATHNTSIRALLPCARRLFMSPAAASVVVYVSPPPPSCVSCLSQGRWP